MTITSMADTLIGFGASSMQGTGDTQGGWFSRAEKLATDPKIRWINRGVGGNTTRDMLVRTTTVTIHAPYRLVVMLGCNDLPRANDGNPARRTTLEEYSSNLKSLFPRIKGSSSLLISSFPVCPKRVAIDTTLFESYMDAAKTAATDNGYEIWDLYEQLRDKSEPYWAADGLHFNDQGHEMIARQFVRDWL